MASRGVNKVILIGNLGADPEVRAMPSGDLAANLRLATSESWKDKDTGEPQERTEWHRVVLFGKLAEIAQQYLQKGSKIYIEGQLRTRKYQGQDGIERWSTEVHLPPYVGRMEMLDPRPQNGQQPRPAQNGWGGAPQQPNQGWGGAQQAAHGAFQAPQGAGGMTPAAAAASAATGQPAPFDDDVPF